MEFRKAFKFVPSKGEVNSGELMVEKAGYIPAKIRIEQIIDAGKRLIEFRKEQFDYNNGEEDLSPDIRTRSKSYDMSDASQDLQDVELRMAKAKKEAMKAKKPEEKKDVKKDAEVKTNDGRQVSD